MTTSRTAQSLRNSCVALIFYLLNLILQFFSRKIFIDHLGTEILGLNTTATNLLQFLNLAELGIGSAIACTLYKPLREKDSLTINEIVSLQGWMYRRIAWIVISGSAVLMAFFPVIFAKMPLPIWYAYASFGVLLISSLLSYFINYKQIVLSADQKEYKIQYSYKATMLLKTACQIAAIQYLDDGYIWWLTLELLFSILASYNLNIIIRKSYPLLKTDLSQGRILNKKYPHIITKIKQLFFHKIAYYALTQTSPIIIYAYASLSLVAIYGNYMLIVLGITSLMGAIFNSMNAGIGNLVAEGNRAHILDVFEELFSIRFLLSCVVCYGVYKLAPAFITLWVGSEYLLDTFTLQIIVFTLYINLTRLTVDAYLNAYGMFSDIWAPITEACLNIGLSIVLGYYMGLHGILIGVLISLIIIVFGWKPYFLFKKGFKEPLKTYIIIYTKHILTATLCILIVTPIVSYIKINPAENALSFVKYGLIITLLFTTILLTLQYTFFKCTRHFIFRSINILKKWQ